MGTFGKVVHLSGDLLLASAFLAGVKRSTGLTPNFESFNNETVTTYGKKYLDVGESIFDITATYFGSSSYFKRT